MKKSGNDENSPKLVLFTPFERESLKSSKRAEKISVFALVATIIAASFVYSQVEQMSYQTQIQASQAMGDAASSTLSAVQIQKQLQIVQSQAKAAQDSVKILNEQLVTSERPWVVAESFAISNIESIGPASTGNGRSALSILGVLTLANTGRSVASSALSYFWILPNKSAYLEKMWDKPCAFTERQRQLASASGVPWPLGILLAPGEKREVPLGGAAIEIPYKDHLSGGSVLDPQAAQSEGFYLLGCTIYDDQLKITRDSQWCFEPNRRGNGGPPIYPFTLKKCQAFEYAN